MARLFDGVDDRIDLANESAFDFERTQEFSIAFTWTWTGAAVQFILGKREPTGGNARGWGILQIPFGVNDLRFQMNSVSGANELGVDTLNAFPPGVSRRGVVTYDGSSANAGVHIYVNGVDQTLEGNPSTLTTTILNAIPMQIGCIGGTATPESFFTGSVCEVAIWSVELSAGEAAAYAADSDVLAIQPASLISYLPLCGFYSPEPDEKGANDGTVTGASAIRHPSNANRCGNSPVAWVGA